MEEIQDTQQENVNPELEEIIEGNAETVNLQNMRAAKEESDRRAQDNARKLEEVERENERLRAMQYKQPVQEEEEDPDYKEDMIDGSHLKKRDKAIKDLQKEVSAFKKETEETMVSNRLSLDHSDYKEVMTKKNLDKLLDKHPEFTDTLGSTTNKYSQYKSMYRLIKKFVYQEQGDPVVTNPVPNKRSISENLAKPMPSNSIGAKENTSPLTRVNSYRGVLSEEEKAERRRLNRIASSNY